MSLPLRLRRFDFPLQEESVVQGVVVAFPAVPECLQSEFYTSRRYAVECGLEVPHPLRGFLRYSDFAKKLRALQYAHRDSVVETPAVETVTKNSYFLVQDPWVVLLPREEESHQCLLCLTPSTFYETPRVNYVIQEQIAPFVIGFAPR